MNPTLFALLLSALLPLPGLACTLWAAAGPDADGGTLLSKNRDWAPDHIQHLQFTHPNRGHAYFGLFASGNRTPGLKGGINEKGLSVITASASSLSKAQLANQRGKRGVTGEILARFASVDELAAAAEQVFPQARAHFYMVSDRHKVLLAEVGLHGEYRVQVIAHGALAHTNHYLDPALAEFNVKIGPSSHARLARINELLTQQERPFTPAQFATLSRDRQNAPDNSLWRNGKQHTLSSWIVHHPLQGAPTLRVLLANPGQAESLHQYVLDEKFWRNARH